MLSERKRTHIVSSGKVIAEFVESTVQSWAMNRYIYCSLSMGREWLKEFLL